MNQFLALTETAATPTAGMSIFILVFYVVMIVVVLYFFGSKPQKKQAQKHEEMMSRLKPGCAIMTTSGFYGIVIDIADDETVIVEFGNNKNCRIPMHKRAIAEIESDEEPAAEETEKTSKTDKKKK